jgi:hypothetical protein
MAVLKDYHLVGYLEKELDKSKVAMLALSSAEVTALRWAFYLVCYLAV